MNAPFEEPIKLGPEINQSNRVVRAACPTSDGRGLLFTRSDDATKAVDSRLYLAVRSVDYKWNVYLLDLPGDDGNANDMTPALSADGRTLIFSSIRPGGHGETDLWMSRRVPRKK